MLALQQEIVHVNNVAICVDYLAQLTAELANFKALADAEMLKPGEERADLWSFWLTHTIELPNWYKCARDIVLITPSSCSVERVFSLLTQCFDDNQIGALEVYKAASCAIKYNSIWRTRDRQVNV